MFAWWTYATRGVLTWCPVTWESTAYPWRKCRRLGACETTAFLWGLGGVRFRDQSSTSVTSLDYENSRSPLGTSILWLCASGGGSRGRGRGWGTHGTSTPSKGVQNTLDWPVQINDMESVRHVKSAAFPVTGGGHVKTPHVACIHHIDMTTTFSDSVEN